MANLNKIKLCSGCAIKKPLDSFGKNMATKDNLNILCKECLRIRGKEYYLKHQEKQSKRKREYARKHKMMNRKTSLMCNYNITLEQYDIMFEEQNGNCAICGLPELMRRLSVDHNHKTKEVRGLLCSKCNQAIGLLHDNTETCFKAYIYLSGGVLSQI